MWAPTGGWSHYTHVLFCVIWAMQLVLHAFRFGAGWVSVTDVYSLWPHVIKYFAKDAIFSFAQSSLPFCSCFHFFLRMHKKKFWNSYFCFVSCDLTIDNDLVVSAQLQHSAWDASAKSKDHHLMELAAIFLYWFLWRHTPYSNHNDTKHRRSYCGLGASTC